MIYVTPGERLSCTTGSAAAPRKRSCHLTRKNSPTSPQNCRVRGVIESISLPRQGNIPQSHWPWGQRCTEPARDRLPTSPSQKTVGDVSSARRGRKGAVENTPSKAHRRIWKSRSCRESGNVEGISLRTGKWR